MIGQENSFQLYSYSFSDLKRPVLVIIIFLCFANSIAAAKECHWLNLNIREKGYSQRTLSVLLSYPLDLEIHA
jgi:hypothetical protein